MPILEAADTSCEKSAGAPEAEIEVTPAMIEAGVRVLWDSAMVEQPMDGPDQLVIERIFLEMSRVAVTRSSR
jgi:hypothetical protein